MLHAMWPHGGSSDSEDEVEGGNGSWTTGVQSRRPSASNSDEATFVPSSLGSAPSPGFRTAASSPAHDLHGNEDEYDSADDEVDRPDHTDHTQSHVHVHVYDAAKEGPQRRLPYSSVGHLQQRGGRHEHASQSGSKMHGDGAFDASAYFSDLGNASIASFQTLANASLQSLVPSGSDDDGSLEGGFETLATNSLKFAPSGREAALSAMTALDEMRGRLREKFPFGLPDKRSMSL